MKVLHVLHVLTFTFKILLSQKRLQNIKLIIFRLSGKASEQGGEDVIRIMNNRLLTHIVKLQIILAIPLKLLKKQQKSLPVRTLH